MKSGFDLSLYRLDGKAIWLKVAVLQSESTSTTPLCCRCRCCWATGRCVLTSWTAPGGKATLLPAWCLRHKLSSKELDRSKKKTPPPATRAFDYTGKQNLDLAMRGVEPAKLIFCSSRVPVSVSCCLTGQPRSQLIDEPVRLNPGQGREATCPPDYSIQVHIRGEQSIVGPMYNGGCAVTRTKAVHGTTIVLEWLKPAYYALTMPAQHAYA